MKTYLVYLVAFLLSIQSYSQSKDTLFVINATTDQFNLDELVQLQPKAIVLEGVFSDRQWKKILSALPKDKALKMLCIQNNELETLPYELSKNYGVKHLIIRQNPYLDLDASGSTLGDWKCLDKVALEVEEAEDIPQEWCAFNHIEQVLCIHPEYALDASLDDVKLPFQKYSTYLTDDSSPAKRLNLEVIGYLPTQPTAKNQHEFFSEKIDTIACQKHYVSFTSPAPKLDEVKTVQVINNTKNQVIVYPKSGTEIFIPANAFVTADGKNITGEVAIDYREFRNPLEFVMSGIPMSNINGADPNNYFRSAGMLEINASINGEEVFLKPDKNVTINFESTDGEENFPLWTFNDSLNQWKEIGQSTPVKKAAPRQILTAAFYSYRTALQQSAWRNDTTSLKNRFESANYRGLFPASRSYQTSINQGGSIVLYNVRRTKAKEVVFSIRNNGHNKELGHLASLSFRLDSEEYTRSKFRRRFSSKKCDLNDARVEVVNGNYILRIKDGKNIIDLPVTPVKYHKKKKSAEEINIKSPYKRYQKTLNRRSTVFNKKISRKKNFLAVSVPTSPEDAYKAAFPLMTEWEKELTLDQWKMHVDSIEKNEIDLLSGTDATASNFTRHLTLNNFGIFNCDQIKRMDEPVIVLANYTKDQNVINTGNKLYVINQKTKSIFYYGFGGYEYTPSRFVMDAADQNLILHFKDEEMAYYQLDPKSFEIDPLRKNTIPLTSIPQGMTTGELATLIGL